MDPYGDPWGVPFPYYQPLSAFVAPATPPAGSPMDAPLVSLPSCINRDWLRLLLGAADSLRSPGNWPGLTESQLQTVLEQVDELKGMLGQWGVCVNPLVDFTFDGSCQPMLHFADGSSRAVVDWATNFCPCVRGCVPPPTITPPGRTDDQAACNVAFWMAGEVIQGGLLAAANQLQISSDLTALSAAINGFMSSVGFFYTALFANVVTKFAQDSIAATLTHLEFAATDPVLKSLIACAIFNGIRGSNSVNAGNLASVVANICAISYTYSDIETIICHFAQNLGLAGWEGLQPIGAELDADCSGCGTYCHYWDLTISPGPWNSGSPIYGHWVSGVGWVSDAITAGAAIQLDYAGFPTTDVTCLDLHIVAPHATGTGHRTWSGYLTGPINVGHAEYTHAAISTPTWERACVNHAMNEIFLDWEDQGAAANSIIIDAIRVNGNGADPFSGVTGCP